MLLDELDAYLDPKNQHLVQETIVALARQGRAFLVSSHSPNNALLYGDRLILLLTSGIIPCILRITASE